MVNIYKCASRLQDVIKIKGFATKGQQESMNKYWNILAGELEYHLAAIVTDSGQIQQSNSQKIDMRLNK